jgi:hypothetical protein
METQDVLAILVAVVFVYGVTRSVWRWWQSKEQLTPLHGRPAAARDWLEKNGYHIVRTAERAVWYGYVDTREYVREWTVDFIVRKNARDYAVKLFDARRDSLSEDRLRSEWFPLFEACGVQGLILIDPDGEVVRHMEFVVRPPARVFWKRIGQRALWLAAGVVMALAWFHAR